MHDHSTTRSMSLGGGDCVPEQLYPLSYAQQRMVRVEEEYPGTTVFNVGGFLKIKGPVDPSLLAESIQLLSKRQSTLRLRFVKQEGALYQYVEQASHQPIEVVDLRDEADPEATATNLAQVDFKQAVSIFDEQLVTFRIYYLAADVCFMYSKCHHAIADGYSVELIARNILLHYYELQDGVVYDDTPVINYFEFVAAEKAYIDDAIAMTDQNASKKRGHKNKHNKAQNFWHKNFAAISQVHLRKKPLDTQGKIHCHHLSPGHTETLLDFAERHAVSLNTVFISLALCYLYQLRESTDISVGTCVMNRLNEREKGIIGQLINDIPFRTHLDVSTDFVTFTKGIHRQIRKCLCYQRYPIELLIDETGIEQQGFVNLFDMCVNYYNAMQFTRFRDFEIGFEEFFNGVMLHRLQLNIKKVDGADGIVVYVIYNTHDAGIDEVKQLCGFLNHVIEQIAEDECFALGKLVNN